MKPSDSPEPGSAVPGALQVSPAGLAAWKAAGFGMFVHWGLYALLGQGEWALHTRRIPPAEYAALAQRFNPQRFDANAWAALAADAGQKYLVITSRHHDGFSMYDTALSEYKVTRTPFGRDPLAELAAACARRGDLRLGFYVSLLDWRHPSYQARPSSPQAWEDYLAFLHGQVRELCTQYGPLACLWFDGDWPHQPHDADTGFSESGLAFHPGGDFRYPALYNLIHRLQPDAVVLNNRHDRPLPGEDVQGFEQDLPGENSAGFNTTRRYDLPVEVCLTINDSWGYNAADQHYKSVKRLAQIYRTVRGLGGNLLLNVGPDAQGEILPAQANILRQLGRRAQQQPGH